VRSPSHLFNNSNRSYAIKSYIEAYQNAWKVNNAMPIDAPPADEAPTQSTGSSSSVSVASMSRPQVVPPPPQFAPLSQPPRPTNYTFTFPSPHLTGVGGPYHSPMLHALPSSHSHPEHAPSGFKRPYSDEDASSPDLGRKRGPRDYVKYGSEMCRGKGERQICGNVFQVCGDMKCRGRKACDQGASLISSAA
jgi:hypothetical protein